MAYIGNQPALGNFVKLDAIVTSATATYNLLNGGVAFSPGSANQCIVSLNGVIQEPTSTGNVGGFTISGSTIVFTSALTSVDVIDFILVLGSVLNLGTPSDATVGFAKVTSNLITGATAETTIAGGDTILLFDDSASALRKMTRTNFVSGLSAQNFPAFQASLNSSFTTADGVVTLGAYGIEDFDTDNCYDNTTNYRFTPTTAGKYCVGMVQRCDNFTADRIASLIMKNGSTFLQLEMGKGGNFDTLNGSAIVTLNGSSDYVDCNLFQNSGVTKTFQGGSSDTYGSRFFAFRIGV